MSAVATPKATPQAPAAAAVAAEPSPEVTAHDTSCEAYSGFTTFTVETKRATNYKGDAVDGSCMAYVTFTDVCSRGGKYAMNVETTDMLKELNDLCEKLEADSDVKVVVFQSAHPEIFIAHYDVDELAEIPPRPRPPQGPLFFIEEVHQRISKLPQATIAKIEGFARGGGHEFCLACDMRFAASSPKVKFMQMEVGLGIIPCGGGTQRIARDAGKGRAMEIVLGARDFDAATAELYGTINRALPPAELGKYVDELANRIAQFPPASIQAGKAAVTAAFSGISIEEGLEVEQYQAGQAWAGTPAHKWYELLKAQGAQGSLRFQEGISDGIMKVDRSL